MANSPLYPISCTFNCVNNLQVERSAFTFEPKQMSDHRTSIPDLVQLSKLDTQFSSEPEYTQHIQYVSGRTPRERRVRKEERWKREREIGRGSFGTVWLERCIYGDSKGKIRAVKKVQKSESSNYYRELEAIALFSHSRASPLLLSTYAPCLSNIRQIWI